MPYVLAKTKTAKMILLSFSPMTLANMVFKAKSNKHIHNIFKFIRAFYLLAAVWSHYYSAERPQLFHYNVRDSGYSCPRGAIYNI